MEAADYIANTRRAFDLTMRIIAVEAAPTPMPTPDSTQSTPTPTPDHQQPTPTPGSAQLTPTPTSGDKTRIYLPLIER